MTYFDAIKYLETRRPLGTKPGLERIKALLSLFSQPQQGLPCIHVAGSNGKGSASAFIAGMLMAQGNKVGQFSSPYLASPCEMIRINGEPISEQDFADLVKEISVHCDVLDKALGQGPTEYEIYTCLALVWFRRSQCDIAVIEACMGGRFDCTNVLEDVKACVITKLSLEHQSFLGNTLEQIAWHKAGIIKEGVPVITYPQMPEAMAVLEREAQARHAPLTIASHELMRLHSISHQGINFDYGEFIGLKLSTPALYQTENAALALTAIRILSGEGLHISDASVKRGLMAVRWPGRFEILQRNPDFILDCCHNPDGVEAFIRSYRALYGDQKAVLIIGVMADKDYEAMVKSLSSIAKAIITIQSDSPRALSSDILKEVASKTCEYVIKSDTIREAVTISLELVNEKEVICALGSHFHAAIIRRALTIQDFGGLLC